MPGVPGMKRGVRTARTGAVGPVILPPVCDLPAPPLPAGRSWSDVERDRWAELWASAPANQWTEASIGLVATLVVLETQVLAGKATAWSVSELRRISEDLGMSPAAQARMNWRVDNGAD